jgi:hypothetical protein
MRCRTADRWHRYSIDGGQREAEVNEPPIEQVDRIG